MCFRSVASLKMCMNDVPKYNIESLGASYSTRTFAEMNLANSNRPLNDSISSTPEFTLTRRRQLSHWCQVDGWPLLTWQPQPPKRDFFPIPVNVGREFFVDFILDSSTTRWQITTINRKNGSQPKYLLPVVVHYADFNTNLQISVALLFSNSNHCDDWKNKKN